MPRAYSSPPPAPRKRTRDEGESLLEVVAAMSVFAVIASAAAALLINGLHTTRSDQDRVRAAALAAREIEVVRTAVRSGGSIGNVVTGSYPWSTPSCAPTATTCTETVDNANFVVSRAVQNIAATASSAAQVQVTASVTWPNMGAVQPVRNTTVLTAPDLSPGAAVVPVAPPVTVTAPTGAVKVTVSGPGSNPIVSQAVSLTTPSGAGLSGTTDATGSVSFAGLPPGTYTASMSIAGQTPPYITPSGNTAAAGIATVVANQTQNVALLYGQASTVTYTVTAPSGYAPPAATLPISVVNDNPGTDRVLTPTANPAASPATTTDTLEWPASAASVHAWMGACTADEPAPFAAPAGVTTNRTIQLSGIQVTVKKALLVVGGIVINSSAVSNAQVVAVKAPDAGCPANVVDPVTGAHVGAVVTFPTLTNSSGIAKVALPAGHWTLEVVGASPALLSAWPSVTVAPGAVDSTLSTNPIFVNSL